VRASAGSVFRVTAGKVKLDEAIGMIRAKGMRLIATSSHKRVPLPEAKLSCEVAIFVGNEGAGLDKKLLARMDELVTIPHSARVESLNAGVAASILLYEVQRQNLFTTEPLRHGENEE